MIQHSPSCQRRKPPILRASWGRTPELWCPECGRTCPAPDTRSASEESRHDR